MYINCFVSKSGRFESEMMICRCVAQGCTLGYVLSGLQPYDEAFLMPQALFCRLLQQTDR